MLKVKQIEVIEPPLDAARFKYLTNQAVNQFLSSGKTREQRYKDLEAVLMGLFRHAYQKGRNDERVDQIARG